MTPAGPPGSPRSRILALLAQCLVQINADPETRGGSGFFVAPGYILTCAHVAVRADDRTVSGLWQGQTWTGRVVFASSPPESGVSGVPDLWPWPDVAVIRLDSALEHPCVRLAAHVPEQGGPMVAMGRFVALNDGPGDFTSGPLHYANPYQEKMLLYGEGVGPGMSGGPLLDERTGDVCGVLKTLGAQGEVYAIPVRDLRDALPPDLADTMLRGHDGHHSRDLRWPSAQESLRQWAASWQRQLTAVAPVLRATEEAQFLGLLAEVDAFSPSALNALYLEAVNDRPLMDDDDPPRDFRDLVAKLENHGYRDGVLHPVILFAELTADELDRLGRPAPVHGAGAADGLRAWATDAATRQGSLAQFEEWRARLRVKPTGTDGPGSIIVQLIPSNHSSTEFRIELSVYRGGINTVRSASPATYPREKALSKARALLAWEMRDHGDRSLMVEFVVLDHMFNEPFELWKVFYRRADWSLLSPGELPPERNLLQRFRLGDLHPVVIRDYERFYEPSERQRSIPLWNQMLTSRNTPFKWLRCGEEEEAQDIGRWFLSHPAVGALGMTWPGIGDSEESPLNQAIYVGVPVAVWRRHRCADCAPGNGGCQGETFARAIDPKISSKSLHNLPEEVRKIRANPNTGPAVEDSLVLLWDDPRRGYN